MIGKIYYWFWHNFLRLQQPLSYSFVQSVANNQVLWMVAGSILLSAIWVLVVHLIALEGNYH